MDFSYLYSILFGMFLCYFLMCLAKGLRKKSYSIEEKLTIKHKAFLAEYHPTEKLHEKIKESTYFTNAFNLNYNSCITFRVDGVDYVGVITNTGYPYHKDGDKVISAIDLSPGGYHHIFMADDENIKFIKLFKN